MLFVIGSVLYAESQRRIYGVCVGTQDNGRVVGRVPPYASVNVCSFACALVGSFVFFTFVMPCGRV